jgi:hypothetical protein
MKKRLTGILICLSLISALSALPLLQQNEWKQYSYAEDGFSISAPVKPVFSTQNKETPAGTVELHNYAVELGANSGVLISSTDFHQTKDVPANVLLQGAKNGAVQALNAKITSEKEITLAGNSGLEFAAQNDTFHMRSRMYMVKGRLLTLLAIAPISTPIPAESGRIFDSFRLVSASK